MNIYREIQNILSTEERAVLATIISTRGSTPAPALSKMLVTKGGAAAVGTVGGGCMEGDVITQASRSFQDDTARIFTFQLDENHLEQGLICGGNLDILLEPLIKRDVVIFRQLESAIAEGTDTILARLIGGSGTVQIRALITAGEDSEETKRLRFLVPDLDELVKRAYRLNDTLRTALPTGELLLEPVQGTPSLLLFGGGHVSRAIARVAALAGFRVTVADDREKYANTLRFPDAERTLTVDFEQPFANIDVPGSSYIVIVTRGHLHDEQVLERALRTNAKYIGMIGSERKVITTYKHLIERGFTPAELERVHAPIGVSIGALTAEEIGVSIVAELVAIRRGAVPPFSIKSTRIAEMLKSGKLSDL